MDFDLILTEEIVQQPHYPPPPPLIGVRARTATIIQEEGITSVVAAEQAGSGWAIAIQDQWRCKDSNCDNHPYVCWLPRTADTPERVESHLAVNGNIVAMWACAINERLCTVEELTDNVRLAIIRAKDRADKEKSRQRSTGDGGADEIKSLTKLLLLGQLKQMST